MIATPASMPSPLHGPTVRAAICSPLRLSRRRHRLPYLIAHRLFEPLVLVIHLPQDFGCATQEHPVDSPHEARTPPIL
jgi:hypothetical protein